MKQNAKWMPSDESFEKINQPLKATRMYTFREKKTLNFSYIFYRFILLIVDRYDDVRFILNKSIDRFTILDNITVIDETTKNLADFFFS